ncbi:MAG: site-2 protease family protein [Clostridiales bacterium]|jgi:stage IV sporulation protein FB|nr:site-2 protease family protein [Clostridiales bacterium]
MTFRVSMLFWILGLIMFLLGLGVEFVAYFLVVLIHEFAHAEVAEKLGYQLKEIRLTPYGASLTGKFETLKCKDEIKIAIAGPLVNLILALFVAAVWWFFPSTYMYSESLLLANIAIFVLNLLPFYPLDGGRILLSLLSLKFKRQKAYKIFRLTGLLASSIFIVFSVFAIYNGANITLMLIAIFVFLESLLPEKISQYQRLYSMAYRSQRIKQGIEVKEIIISSQTSLGQAFAMLNSKYYHRFCIMKNESVLARISESQLEDLVLQFGYELNFGECAFNNLPKVVNSD